MSYRYNDRNIGPCMGQSQKLSRFKPVNSHQIHPFDGYLSNSHRNINNNVPKRIRIKYKNDRIQNRKHDSKLATQIRVITKLPNSEQSYKGKVKKKTT